MNVTHIIKKSWCTMIKVQFDNGFTLSIRDEIPTIASRYREDEIPTIASRYREAETDMALMKGSDYVIEVNPSNMFDDYEGIRYADADDVSNAIAYVYNLKPDHPVTIRD